MYHKKTKAVLAAFCLIVIFITFTHLKSSNNLSEISIVSVDYKDPGFKNLSGPVIYAKPANEKSLPSYHPNEENLSLLRNTFNGSLNDAEIVKSLEYLNDNHEIINSELYGGVENIGILLVVQVHDRLEYLKLLIDSLKNVKGIEKALLVFSHDYFSEDINGLIQNIRFCQVVQIFYPYPMQIFHNRFPGPDPNDCPEKMKKEEAEMKQCNNWKTPDSYGNYRKAQLSQIKLHWWWKMNYVMDGIIVRYNITAQVLLLEEDHMVTPDIFYVLQKVTEIKHTMENPDNYVISLGLFSRNYNFYQRDIFKIGVQTFYGKHNTGIVLDNGQWRAWSKCANMFCTYDDYNWDWSLIHMSYDCLPSKLTAIYAKSPRVLHIGDCGVHTHKCSSQTSANKVKSLFERIQSSFFPEKMQITERLSKVPKISKPNGGWGDKRDHELCNNNTSPYFKTKENS
uniref:Alpha-1,6-mannosyl-glycoprotein 2-beta-N-acetylglucosaminyltransferase n=1 Tax=Panagrolaimus sp. ES5 TaxID=591445 RepID=A0AC34F0A7_9BILA